MDENKTLNDAEKIIKAYNEAVDKRIRAAQESGDVPNDFVYSFNGKTWVMVLPQSVMTQKRLLHMRDMMLANPNSPDADEAYIRSIAKYIKVNGVEANVEYLTYGEIEVMKLAYMDGLLNPLSLGGENSVKTYMLAAAANLK